jgi:hypothetical protein
MALERRNIDRPAGLIHVRRTVSDREVVELAKTSRSRRQVPLSRRGVAALDRLPARFNPPLLLAAPGGGLVNLDNFRRRYRATAFRGNRNPGDTKTPGRRGFH